MNPAVQFFEPGEGRHTKPDDEAFILKAIRDISYWIKPVRGLKNFTAVDC